MQKYWIDKCENNLTYYNAESFERILVSVQNVGGKSQTDFIDSHILAVAVAVLSCCRVSPGAVLAMRSIMLIGVLGRHKAYDYDSVHPGKQNACERE